MAYAMYADESISESRRFHSFSVVSGTTVHLDALREQLDIIAAGGSEAKFHKLNGDSRRSGVAYAFIEKAIAAAASHRIRIDTIIWDQHSPRNAVHGRDDAANYERMAYHLLTKTAQRHSEYVWDFFPDEGAAANWEDLMPYLNKTPLNGPARLQEQESRLFIDKLPPLCLTLKPLASHEDRLIQLADLFAGVACFSREQERGCAAWWKDQWNNRAQQCLFELSEVDNIVDEASRRKTAQYDVTCYTYKTCRQHKLGVSLETCGYLRTRHPANAVNFWHYEEQHEEDRAPTR